MDATQIWITNQSKDGKRVEMDRERLEKIKKAVYVADAANVRVTLSPEDAFGLLRRMDKFWNALYSIGYCMKLDLDEAREMARETLKGCE
jgi:hypothetical protein